MKSRAYLDGHSTTIYMDYKPLVHFFIRPNLSKRQARQVELLSELPITIKNKLRPIQVVPDTMSRHPVRTLAYFSREDAALDIQWLRSNIPQHTLADCVQAAIDALSAKL